MGAFVLAVGALLVVAGVYSMVSGSGEILSERGWSAYIAGSELLSGGVVTMALGLAVRSLAGLRLAIASGIPALPGSSPQAAIEPMAAAAGIDAAPLAPADRAFAASATAPALATFSETLAPSTVPPPPAPLAQADDPPQPLPRAAPLSIQPEMPATSHEDQPPHHGVLERMEPDVTQGAPEPAAPHEDWLEQSFADLEREMAGGAPATAHAEPLERSRPEPAGSAHLAAVTSDAPAQAHEQSYEAEPVYNAVEPFPAAAAAVLDEPRREEPRHDPVVSEPVAAEAAHDDPAHEHATVSAREAEPMPQHESPVIGRYESEGTSYVMYADGSIDAQSEAGVYRFASMAELKAFIES